MNQHHLGKFLKLHSLEYPIIEYQLFNFSKESLKQIFLNSKCGELINGKEFKDRPPSTDLTGNKNIYPISFVYKKAKPKIKPDKQIYHWKDDKIKKKIDILSNSYMTFSILLLADYYNEITLNEKKRTELTKFYINSAKCQLNYYIENFRNELGLFVDKILNQNLIENKTREYIEFEINKTTFNFSAQSYLMSCFLKCSKMLKDTSPYKLPFFNFSKEIEKMFIDFKDKILDIKPKDLIELLHSFEVYLSLDDNLNKEILEICLDIIDSFSSKHSLSSLGTYDKILFYTSLVKLKSYLSKHNDKKLKDYKNIVSEYIWDLDEILSNKDFYKNEILNVYDLIAYTIYLIKFKNEEASKFYEEILIPSNIFSCFPNVPKKYESERYFHLEHKEHNKIPDKYFKPLHYQTMDEAKITPIICKELYFSQDKNKFSKPKVKFDSLINMRLIFLTLYNLKDIIVKKTK